MKLTQTLAGLLACLFLFSACENDDHDHDHSEEELPTTAVFTFTNVADATDKRVFTWEDIDGVGGNGPNRIDTVQLEANKSYTYNVQLLNSNETPAEDLTSAISSAKDQHQFFYTVTPSTLATVTITDKDSRDLPVGLVGTVQTSSAGIGSLETVLYHYDSATDKNGSNKSDESDITTTMPIIVR